MKARSWLALITVWLSLTIAGCAASGTDADNDKRGTFYGGVFGAGTLP
jgi:hypothetical protein